MNRLAKTLFLLPLFALLLHAEPQIVYIHSPKDVFALFDKLDYTSKQWNEGIREVPRVFLSGIPKRWPQNAQELPVEKKKDLFFQLLTPAVLHANDLMLRDREKLTGMLKKERRTSHDRMWLQELAAKYGLKQQASKGIDDALIEELLLRVDAVAVSLALAQSADESGWGTSRFAVLGNSLFGQWSFNGRGIIPHDQRKQLGDYKLARFATPQDAVNAYLLNLNTEPAYADFRKLRARMRAAGKPLSGYELAGTLTKYSERGEAYVDNLRGIIRANRLHAADAAYLREMEAILLVPAGSAGK